MGISLPSPWSFPILKHISIALVLVLVLILMLPIVIVVSSIFSQNYTIWQHLSTTVLPTYIRNSLVLMVGVGIGTITIGVGTAWLVTMCRFPGRRLWQWLLLLPLAAPAYLLAYIYTELLAYYGPVQTTLRQWFGWQSFQEYWFPDIRSMGGAIGMLVLVLYPYVYLLARLAFLEQSVCTLEASRSLGCHPWRGFWTVALPLARPSIVSGVALALMETLNDYGTVQFFGIDTFTTGIYRTWFGLGERPAAMQLAAMLTLFVLWLILLEAWSRRQARYYQTFQQQRSQACYFLGWGRGSLALLACLFPILLGFLLPTGFLIYFTFIHREGAFQQEFWQLCNRSFILAVVTAGLGAVIAIAFAYVKRRYRHSWIHFILRIAALGYAIPGSVIAVGTLVPLGTLDGIIDEFMDRSFGIKTGLLFSGTVFALIFAYLVRFLAVTFNTITASLEKVKPHVDEAARSLGSGSLRLLLRIHVPMIWGSVLTGSLLLFVDVMKELPATLVMRPFNWETLAVRVYQYAADERLSEAAAPALSILIVGMIPVFLLSWQISRSRAEN